MTELDLTTIRQNLIRLEETIIFALLERAQYCVNAPVYQPGACGKELGTDSLLLYILRETERAHARVRRYLAPDEHPFCTELPPPLLPPVEIPSPIHDSSVCLNAHLLDVYTREIIPFVCSPGEDDDFGSTAVCDVTCLQMLSRRIHFGKFVAESKFRETPTEFTRALRASDADAIMELVTHPEVERAVLDRVLKKATTYTAELRTAPVGHIPTPEAIAEVYHRWIIPLNKQVQVAYLLEKRIVQPTCWSA